MEAITRLPPGRARGWLYRGTYWLRNLRSHHRLSQDKTEREFPCFETTRTGAPCKLLHAVPLPPITAPKVKISSHHALPVCISGKYVGSHTCGRGTGSTKA